MSAIRIGAYQLRNLARNQLKFVYLDLRTESERARLALDPELTAGAQAATAADAIEAAKASASGMDFPVVVLCQTGEASLMAAEALEAAGFVNVFVVAGGAQELAQAEGDPCASPLRTPWR